ncbi:MAG: Mur ligase family protein [candidate division SR1 bacterium]|nr:Mur ligase family protein [candidate division SR1 bacterium]
MKKKLLRRYYKLLGKLAHGYIAKHNPQVIGINGSVGKTSCRMIVYQTLQQFITNKKIYTSPKNFNGELGLSLSIFQIEKWEPNIFCFISTLTTFIRKRFFGSKPYDIILLEYGIDRPGEMDFLLTITKPHIGIFTAIDSVHSEQFGNPGEIAREEVKMLKSTLELGFLNANDTYAIQLKQHLYIDYLTYQTEGYDIKADIYFKDENFFVSDFRGGVGVQFHLRIKEKKYSIKTNILGKANYGYIGLGLAIAGILDYKYARAESKAENPILRNGSHEELSLTYKLQPGRLSVFAGIENSVVIDSTYNASPLSVRKIINTAHNIRQQLFPQRKILLVLGDMRELGDLTEREHRMIAGYVSQVADHVILVGKYMTDYLADELEKVGYDKNNVEKFYDANIAGKHIQKMLKEDKSDYVIVCKGSQNTIFLEEAVKHFLVNPEDHKELTRQSDRRLNKKKKYFS